MRIFRNSHIACLVVLALLLPLALPIAGVARTRASQDKKEKKDEQKKDEQKKEEKPKLTKEEKEYQKIKKFSLDLYLKDADFRDSCEDAYLKKQREHSEYAYYINTRNPGFQQVTRDGDKLTVEYTLYDNPLAQDYVNRVGQSLVPVGSNRLYTFRIMLNPIPESRALSTGTIYISSGLLSIIDNEAQLSYVLGHEIAHVEKEHWKEDVLVAQGIEPYNEKQAKKRALIGAIVTVAAGAVAGAAGGSVNTVMNTMFLAYTIAPTVTKLWVPNAITSWDRLQEDEADQLGLKYMLDRSYDVREVPKFYANLRSTASLDPRVRLGFIADKDRLTEREEQVKSLIGNSSAIQKTLYVGSTSLAPGKMLDPSKNAAERADAAQKNIDGAMAADIRAKLDAGELIGNSAEFEAVMAGITRDNGVRAYHFDMFKMARENLEESLRIRSNDPYAHYYYGKVLKLTARTSQEKLRALAEFAQAIQLDRRKVIAEPYLYRALSMIDAKDPGQMQEIVTALKDYVAIYQREHSGALPPNMEVIYDYMQEAGEVSWAATPAMNVSTKGIEPIGAKMEVASRPASPPPTDNQTAPAQPVQPTKPAPKRRP
ncbi:MAG TPA: M48 family metalloprotease [Pyrinomonadaceae bacterium]